MKLLHAADIHLDSPLRGLERYDGAPVERIRGATRAAFQNLVTLALEERVELLLIAGDLYDSDWKDYATGLFFRRQMLRLAEGGIPVVMIRGNHDARSRLTKQLLLPENVRELPTKHAGSVVFEELGVAVHGQGFETQAVTENLALKYPEPISGAFNIGLLHTALDGRPGHAPYAPCTLSVLQERGYDYWALGHVHQHEILSREPWVVYPGNLQGRHLRETGLKGACLVDVEEGRITKVEHQALDVVRFQLCRVDARELCSVDGILNAVEAELGGALKQADGRLLAARVEVFGATSAHHALQNDVERFTEEVRGRGLEFGDELFIERVRVSTDAPLDLLGILSRDDAIGQLAKSLERLREDPAEREELFQALIELNDLPAELRTGLDPWLLSDPGVQEALLADVERLLLPRLLGESTRE